jgi:glycosyltransferase involved in cell wall biosynthesis
MVMLIAQCGILNYFLLMIRKDKYKAFSRGCSCQLAIASIAKNEAPYLKEWIEYHKIVGVEKFYIYDNGSTDNTREVLKPYIDEKTVVYKFFPGKFKQMAAYEDAIKKYKFSTKWMIIMDLDEFIVPIQYDSIPDFLKDFEDCEQILINLATYGSSGHKTKPQGLVIENYKKRGELDETSVCSCRCILNPRLVSPRSLISNRFFTFGKTVDENKKDLGISRSFDIPCGLTARKIRGNHYYTKSLEEYFERGKKGDAYEKKCIGHRNMQLFEDLEGWTNKVYDDAIGKYTTSLEHVMKK